MKDHRTTIKKLLRIADSTTEVCYTIGNHDIYLQEYLSDGEGEFGNITFADHFIHESINGKRYLVIHGHQFDGIVNMHPWLYSLGDNLYHLMHLINNIQNKIRKMFGYNEFSFAHWIKSKTKGAIKFIAQFDKLIVDYAKRYHVDGVISSHIHVPSDQIIDNIHALNTGCWAEICSAILEDEDGNITCQRLD